MDTKMAVNYAWLAVVRIFVPAVPGTPAWASPISITVNTAALASSRRQLAFDIIDDGPPTNSVTISCFATDPFRGSATAACVRCCRAH